MTSVNKGVLSALAAYLIWGIFPVYWKLLTNVPALQIMTHRVVWSFVFVTILLSLRRDWAGLRQAINRRTVVIYLLAGILLAVNWLTYIWSVNAGFILESSLGYFINPLVSVLLGVVFLREKLRPWQWAAVGLAALGVNHLTIAHGSLPWISLGLAFTFGMYGFIKKLAPLGSLNGLTLETALILVPALAYLLLAEANGTGAFGHLSAFQNVLLVLTGVVTAIPLLLFSEGARRIPLATLGLLQYVSPTLQFLFGVLVYHEAFTHERVIGFSIIWVALALYSAEGLLVRQRTLNAAPAN
ncbi:MAG TPA: EamA family transporter RarD [Anaerolinea sp.]|nr:EamA family transporter RarD [Anaerolinea sp.]